MSGKELCGCGQTAVWCYLPGYSGGGNPYHCDDCVPRGCSCEERSVDTDSYFPPLDEPNLPDPEDVEGIHWKWIKKDVSWCYIDSKGREYPCCEYDYDEDGFNLE